MNSKSRTNRIATLLFAFAMVFPAFNTAKAGDDNYGVWTTFEASKKINKKFKVGAELEFRSNDYLKDIERFAIGLSGQYKVTDWLKANAGYIFIAGYNPKSISVKEDTRWIDMNGEEVLFPNYNVDHSYWEKRNRVYLSATADYKIGRISLSLRERLQYTRTNSALIDEDKHRHDSYLGGPRPTETIEHNKELKEHKNNTVLRSRLTAKWDIPKCKVNPFVSTELYSRLDKWRGFEKLRSRIGASYKINKDNAFEIYYLFEKAGEKGKANTHAIGLGYSIDL
ncbi:MAG: DUF2490 domain-containing protein [Bacteroidaceae bacterium]|nr:DUF2490 domain-containing protein [Bacteroidaceae bacterium]